MLDCVIVSLMNSVPPSQITGKQGIKLVGDGRALSVYTVPESTKKAFYRRRHNHVVISRFSKYNLQKQRINDLYKQ